MDFRIEHLPHYRIMVEQDQQEFVDVNERDLYTSILFAYLVDSLGNPFEDIIHHTYPRRRGLSHEDVCERLSHEDVCEWMCLVVSSPRFTKKDT